MLDLLATAACVERLGVPFFFVRSLRWRAIDSTGEVGVVVCDMLDKWQYALSSHSCEVSVKSSQE